MPSRRQDGGADSKYLKDGPLEKRLNLSFVDLKTKIATSQGHFLGEAPYLTHGGREHRIWKSTNLGASPDLATSWVSGLKQFSASLHSLHLCLYTRRLILSTLQGLFQD